MTDKNNFFSRLEKEIEGMSKEELWNKVSELRAQELIAAIELGMGLIQLVDAKGRKEAYTMFAKDTGNEWPEATRYIRFAQAAKSSGKIYQILNADNMNQLRGLIGSAVTRFAEDEEADFDWVSCSLGDQPEDDLEEEE